MMLPKAGSTRLLVVLPVLPLFVLCFASISFVSFLRLGGWLQICASRGVDMLFCLPRVVDISRQSPSDL